MKRAVALLDVDHTLLFDIDDEINENLTRALLDNGIDRVYLFTDMTLNANVIEERNRLVKGLEEMGFAVQGVITPNDLVWGVVTTVDAVEIHRMCVLDNIYKGKFHGPDFETFLQNNHDSFPSIYRAATTYNPSVCVFGEAFNEASLENYRDQSLSDATKIKSIFAKVLADHLSQLLGYKHVKGLLFDAFIRQMPTWVSSVLVFDDNQNVIADIENFLPVKAATSKINVMIADTLEEAIIPHTTMVPVTSKDTPLRHYNSIISAHLQQLS